MKRTPLPDRLYPRCVPEGDCLVWTGATLPKGYGVIGRGGGGGGQVTVHRASFEIHNGPIPEGMWVLHSCDNPPCVNPDHLFLGTEEDNRFDMYRKGRTAQSPLKTECYRGHPLTGPEADVYTSKKGHRDCRKCRRIRRSK